MYEVGMSYETLRALDFFGNVSEIIFPLSFLCVFFKHEKIGNIFGLFMFNVL